MSCSCKHKETKTRGSSKLRNITLGKYLAHFFDNYLLLSFSKDWLKLNDGKPIVFDAKIENGKLLLCANLARLQSNKEVLTHGK